VKRYRIANLVLKEISCVRKPAHEGATIDLTKSDDRIVLMKSEATSPAPPTPPENKNMLTDQEKLAKAQSDNETLTAKLAKAEKYGALSDLEKSHYERLNDAQRGAFLDMTPAQRAEETKPVYTSPFTGVSFTKADDQRVVTTVKSADEQRAADKVKLDKAEESLLKAEVEKDFGHLPGTIENRTALVKAAKAIGEDAVAILKAQNTALAKGFQRQGSGSVSPTPTEPAAKLDALVKAHMTANKVDEATAYDAVVSTPEGAELYKAMH
jgi:hypothetical protein